MPFDFSQLDQAFAQQVQQLIARCQARGFLMVPYSGRRTPAEQARLWRKTRTAVEIKAGIEKLKADGAPWLASVLDGVGPQPADPEHPIGHHVTKVLPGNSWHQWAQAVDCYWSRNGQAHWNPDDPPGNANGYRIYAAEAPAVQLTAGGNWPNFKDWPHVQLSGKDNPEAAGNSWPQIDAKMKALYDGAPLV